MPTPSRLDDFLFDLRGYLVLPGAIADDLVDRLRDEFAQMPPALELGGWYRGAQRRDYNTFAGYELHHVIELGGPFEDLIDHPSWIDHVRHYCGEEDSYVAGVFIDECIAMVRGPGSHHPLHSGGWRTPLRCLYHYDHCRFR